MPSMFIAHDPQMPSLRMHEYIIRSLISGAASNRILAVAPPLEATTVHDATPSEAVCDAERTVLTNVC